MSVRSSRGFALIETLVAAAIISAMLGMVFQSIESGARQTRMVEDRRRASLIAQSQLAAIGASQTTRFGETAGLTSGVTWRITVQPYRADQSSAVRLDLISVAAGIEGGTPNLVTLKTLRVSR